MRPEDLLKWIRAVPFVPFQIQSNSGRIWDIRHPELIHVGRSTMYIFSYRGERDEPFEDVEMVSLLLVESVKPLEAPRLA
jgi:hypothetical protein